MCDNCQETLRQGIGRDAREQDLKTFAGASQPAKEKDIVAELFTYHLPTHFAVPKFEAVRAAGKYFAEVILANCPRGTDRNYAIESVRSAVMRANAAISLDGLSL